MASACAVMAATPSTRLPTCRCSHRRSVARPCCSIVSRALTGDDRPRLLIQAAAPNGHVAVARACVVVPVAHGHANAVVLPVEAFRRRIAQHVLTIQLLRDARGGCRQFLGARYHLRPAAALM